MLVIGGGRRGSLRNKMVEIFNELVEFFVSAIGAADYVGIFFLNYS